MDIQQFISGASFKEILDQVTDGLYLVDSTRRIVFWNKASERITGFSEGRVTGQFCMANILMHVNDAGDLLCLGKCPLAHSLLDGQDRTSEVFLHHADGHRVSVSVRVIPIKEGEGENQRITGAIELFSENINLAFALARIDEAQRLINLDELTGIANRRMVQIQIEKAYQDWTENHIPFGLLMLDVDHFKAINDTYGHAVGDRALKMVAASLSNGLRSYDLIGRWGGEEFVAVILNVDETQLKMAAERLRMLVESSFLTLGDGNTAIKRSPRRGVRVTISVGAALVKGGDTAASLLERADQCMYESKRMGRNRVTT